jgi:hypothetical protein
MIETRTNESELFLLKNMINFELRRQQYHDDDVADLDQV